MHGAHDDLPVRDADVGRVLQLPDPVDDRRARRRVPAHQRVQLLAVPVRRVVPVLQLVPGRRAERRLVRLRAELHHRPDAAASTFCALGLLLTGIASTGRRRQPRASRSSTCARPACRSSGMPVFVWMGLVDAALCWCSRCRSSPSALFELLFDRRWGTHFFDPTRGRRPDPVAAPVLAVRPPRGVHPDPAGVRHRLRGPAGVLAASRCSATSSWCSPASRSGSSASACGRTTCSRAGLGPVGEHGVRHLDR